MRLTRFGFVACLVTAATAIAISVGPLAAGDPPPCAVNNCTSPPSLPDDGPCQTQESGCPAGPAPIDNSPADPGNLHPPR
jgi:hypothetical protein